MMAVSWTTVRQVLKDVFGIERLRDGQRPIIRAVLDERDTLGVLPTGAGKSLCFQLPAQLVGGTTVVVSPLLALIQDQKEKLEGAGVAVSHLDSTLTHGEEKAALSTIGKTDRIVYVTPERLERPEVIEKLRARGVGLLVVDEAHCVSQWGHDFRPAFLGIRRAVKALGNPPILALTATATEEIQADIIRQLGMRDPVVVRTGAERTNLFFDVRRTPSEDAKLAALLSLLRERPAESTIVYTATVASAEALQAALNASNIDATIYHGRLRKSTRLENQHAFMSGEKRVVVATSAFGLGIDKPDVRMVVHYMFPESLETYYQEAGRAGRDGAPARAILLYRLEDRRVRAFFLGGKYPRREDLLAVYDCAKNGNQSINELANESGVSARRTAVIVAELEAMGVVRVRRGIVALARDFDSRAELDRYATSFEARSANDHGKLDEMMHYAQSTDCRIKTIVAYLGEDHGGGCRHCDNCRDHASELLAAPRSLRVPPAEAPAERFARGDRVRHGTLGEGIVDDVSLVHVHVFFDDANRKRVSVDQLQKLA